MKITVGEILRARGTKRAVITAKPTDLLPAAAAVMFNSKIHSLVIVDSANRPAAIVTEHDILRAVAEFKGNVANVRLEQVMTRNPFTCTTEHMIPDIKSIMTERRFRHVLVVDSRGRLVDIFSMGDVVGFQVKVAEANEERVLERLAG